MAAGIVGDPALIPWLIEMMAVPELARLAGEAFTMITGMDLVYRDLDREPPSSEDVADGPIEAILDLDYESNLPWPSLERITAWWTENKSQFTPGVRHLDGRPIARSAALETLATGKQRLRAAAALELALLDPAEILFEVRARGDWQQHARGL